MSYEYKAPDVTFKLEFKGMPLNSKAKIEIKPCPKLPEKRANAEL